MRGVVIFAAPRGRRSSRRGPASAATAAGQILACCCCGGGCGATAVRSSWLRVSRPVAAGVLLAQALLTFTGALGIHGRCWGGPDVQVPLDCRVKVEGNSLYGGQL